MMSRKTIHTIALVDTVMLPRTIVQYIERIDTAIEQETVDGLQLMASLL
jgi:hypothetical protein